MKTIDKVKSLVSHITCDLLGKRFNINVSHDKIHGDEGRIYIQIQYNAPCTHSGVSLPFNGRKYYLSEYMTDDEVVKTCYVAFEQAIKHEIMEGFKFDGQIVFNPHTSFRDLLKVTNIETTRENGTKIIDMNVLDNHNKVIPSYGDLPTDVEFKGNPINIDNPYDISPNTQFNDGDFY